jgi:hypothetical protein
VNDKRWTITAAMQLGIHELLLRGARLEE